jgi:hypothetical protein
MEEDGLVSRPGAAEEGKGPITAPGAEQVPGGSEGGQGVHGVLVGDPRSPVGDVAENAVDALDDAALPEHGHLFKEDLLNQGHKADARVTVRTVSQIVPHW